jgi:hypothetical protein
MKAVNLWGSKVVQVVKIEDPYNNEYNNILKKSINE